MRTISTPTFQLAIACALLVTLSRADKAKDIDTTFRLPKASTDGSSPGTNGPGRKEKSPPLPDPYRGEQEKAQPGLHCALEHGLFCGYCLSAKSYLDCQSLLFGKKEKLHVPEWAKNDPVAFVKGNHVAGKYIPACAGFVSFLMREMVCTSGMNRAQFEAEGFAREAALKFKPPGGELYAMKGMVEWMPPGDKAAVRTITRRAVSVSVRKNGKVTPSARERFTSNVQFTSREAVQRQWLNMLRGFPRACPKPKVVISRRGSGWQTAVRCKN